MQGPADAETAGIIKTYRKKFPNSEIILSTWEGINQHSPEIDKIIANKDPGNLISKKDPLINCNINRQIVSSKAGVNAASRDYILKVRSDIAAKNSSIIKKYNQYDDGGGRILIGNSSAKNPDGLYKAYFHFSDWYMLSNKKNIIDLFEIPLMQQDDMDVSNETENIKYYTLMSVPKQKYSAETYIWKHYIEKRYGVKIEYEFDVNKKIISAQEQMLKKNLIIINNKDSGLQIQKSIYKNLDSKLYFEYTFQDWKVINGININEPYMIYKIKFFIKNLKGLIFLIRCFIKKL